MRLPALILCILLFATARPVEPVESDFGIFYRRGTDVEGNARTQALGPVWDARADGEGRSFHALRPVFARSEDTGRKSSQWEGFFPLVGGFTLNHEYYNRVLLLYRKVKDVTREDSPRKWMLFPFFYQGISNKGEPYAALFPFGGTIRDFLSRDEIRFVLWPLYTKSRVKNVETTNILFPFYSTTKGGGIDRVRYFPFYGETRFKDRYVKKFVLWPFWNSVNYTIPGSEGSGWILWPLCGHIKLADQETTYVVPPLFRFSKTPTEERNAVFWPFYQRSTGSVEKTYYFPFWGTKTIGSITKSFALWPICLHSRTEAFDETRDYRHVNPFWHSATITPVSNHTPRAVSRELWPLFSYQRDGDHSRFRMLELWPGRDPEGVERNLSPLFAPFTRERKGDNADTEVLWGVVRHVRRGPDYRHFSVFPLIETRREATGSRWTVLKGLVESSVHDGERTVRLLYFLRF